MDTTISISNLTNINTIKKKRGRPKKNQQLVNIKQEKKVVNFCNEEIILTLDDIDKHMIEQLYTNKSNETIKEIIKPEIKPQKKQMNYINNETNSKAYVNKSIIINSSKENVIVIKNSACWWCTYEFDNEPCYLPDRYGDNKYYVFGCFCSFNCALAYNINLRDYKVWERISLLNQLYYDSTKTNEIIDIAPSKEILKKYGGILTIEEYRKNFLIKTKKYLILPHPIIVTNPVIEEKTL